LCQETLIVDRPHRSLENLKRFQRVFEKFGVALGRQLGVTHISGATPRPKAMLKVLGPAAEHWYTTETFLRRDL
jgi:hypothetical protein